MKTQDIRQFSLDLAYEIVNHGYEEVSEPETLAEIIEKFIEKYETK